MKTPIRGKFNKIWSIQIHLHKNYWKKVKLRVNFKKVSYQKKK